MKKYFSFLIVFSFLISNSVFSQQLTKKQILEDLAYYRDTLPVKHKKLYDKISKAEFEQKISVIASKADTLNYETFMIELFRLNASIGDEHTRIEPRFTQSLPIKFEMLEDGIFVTGIDPQSSTGLLCKLVAIDGHSIYEINSKFAEVIKHDNRSYFEINRQQFLNNPVFLKGLGILHSDKSGSFALQNARHETINVTLNAVDKDIVKLATVSQYKTLLPYKEGDKNYWYEYDASRKIIYFNFQHCIEDDSQPFSEFNKALFAKIESTHPDKIIIDLRFNSGGNSGVLTPFIDSIKQSYLNKAGHFFVLTGKSTFSSALMNAIEFKRNTNAILVGQMTSGNINHYGEVRGFRLPNSKMVIGYSTMYWENWKGKTGALMPDKLVTYSSENFINNRDEALEYIYKE